MQTTMCKVRITIERAVTLLAILSSGLLLVSAANCSFEKHLGADELQLGAESPEVVNQGQITALPQQVEPLQAATESQEPSAERSSAGKPTDKAPEPREAFKPPEGDVFVANPFCVACHYGFDGEDLALRHECAGVGCERCHGESARHRSDESNTTAPQIMWPRIKINPMCMMCHPRHKIKHVTEHEVVLAGAETIFDAEPDRTVSAGKAGPKLCTDCHGKNHRVNVRSIRWNKATGELLSK